MFNKLKGAVAAAGDKIAEKKAEYQEKKQGKWLPEVNPTGTEFLPLQGWKDQYEPKKVGKEAKDGASGPNALQQRAMDALAKRITTKIMTGLTEVVATPLDVAAREMKGKDAQLASLLNLLTAVVLSYRFQYKDKKKFPWIRSVAVDKLAVLLVSMVDAEAKRTGADPANLSPEQIQAIIDGIAGRVNNELTSRAQVMTDALNNSPMFSAHAAAAAASASSAASSSIGAPVSVDVDAGVSMMVEMLRGYVAGKLSTVTTQLTAVVSQLTAIAVKYRGSVLASVATAAAAPADEADPDVLPEEYQKGCKAELLAAIEGKYTEIEGTVSTFITQTLKLVDNGPEAEE